MQRYITEELSPIDVYELRDDVNDVDDVVVLQLAVDLLRRLSKSLVVEYRF